MIDNFKKEEPGNVILFKIGTKTSVMTVAAAPRAGKRN